MSVAIQLKKLKMFREWLEYQQAYDDRDEEAERWAEFIQIWENDKALNRLAESYAAEMISYFSCPVCAGYCYQEGDTADCENCQIRWSVINAGEYTYLEAESEDYGVENVWMSESFRDWADDELRTHGENVSFEKWSQEEFEDEPAHRHANGQLSFVQWARDELNEEHHNAEDIQQDYPFWSVVKVMSDGIDYDWGIEDHDSLEEAKEYCDYYNENLEGNYVVMENESPGEWEEKCAECGSSRKDAETFSAETADGNQVFNSCWKCGSGQHLNQISRYPASPQEIAGVGGDESQASTDWKSGRPMQR